MTNHHNFWKNRPVRQGPPSDTADPSNELEVSIAVEENDAAVLKTRVQSMKSRKRPFALLVKTKLLLH